MLFSILAHLGWRSGKGPAMPSSPNHISWLAVFITLVSFSLYSLFTFAIICLYHFYRVSSFGNGLPWNPSSSFSFHDGLHESFIEFSGFVISCCIISWLFQTINWDGKATLISLQLDGERWDLGIRKKEKRKRKHMGLIVSHVGKNSDSLNVVFNYMYCLQMHMDSCNYVQISDFF